MLWELFTEWPAAEKMFLAVPVWAAGQVGWPGGRGWFEGIWILGVVPLALWSAVAAVWRLLGNPERVTAIWRRMTLPLAVIIAVGHMSKGLAKFVSWAPFLPQALRDPHGLDTAQAIAGKTVAAPPPLIGMTAVAVGCLGLMSLALVYAVREYRLAHPDEPAYWRRWFPIPTLAVMFSLIIAGWMGR